MNDKIADYLDEVQAGQSRVLVKGHVVVAGWSSKLPSLLTEFGEHPHTRAAPPLLPFPHSFTRGSLKKKVTQGRSPLYV